MPSLTPSDVVLGCVTEDSGKYLDQTVRLLHSIRWFGGSLAETRIVIGAVERLDARARRAFEALGAEVRIIPRFHARNATANRLQLFEHLLGEPLRHLLFLDNDTIVARDPLPLLRPGVFQAKIEPLPTVTHEVFERLFAHFGLPLPPRSYVTGYTHTKTIPYFNAGVLSMPADVAVRLVPEWRRFNTALADRPELAAPCAKHIHQAALALALASTGIPVEPFGPELNYQLNATHLAPPPGYLATDPAIIHYHHLVDDEGWLLPCPFPLAQKRIDAFNDRLAEERARVSGLLTPSVIPSVSEGPGRAGGAPQSFFVLGMERSGTSLVTRLLHAMGCYAGETHNLANADVFHPHGRWEHRDVHVLNAKILSELGTTWLEPDRAKVENYVERGTVRKLLDEFNGHGPFVIKDRLLPLLFPLWRDAAERPVCVLVWRDPMSLARSFARRDGLPVAIALGLWESYTRAMLASTIGLPRVLVAYHDLVGNAGTATALYRDLVAAGATFLREPNVTVADPALDADRGDDDGELLNRDQRTLRDALRSGAALQWTSVEPVRAETRHLLAEHARAAAAHEKSAQLQIQLEALYRSRTWRLAATFRKVWRSVVRT